MAAEAQARGAAWPCGPRRRRPRAGLALLPLLPLLPLCLGPPAAGPALLGRQRPRVLLKYRDHELLLRPRAPGRLLPRLELRRTPPRPLALGPAAGSAEGPLGGELLGFPFTTRNAASLQLGLPRVSGRLTLSAEDPAAADEESQRAAELAYEQPAPGLGDVSARLRTTGEWQVAFSRQVEDLGRLRGSLNSQRDWSLDLDSTYPPVRSLLPSVSYGATQDGVRVRAGLQGPLSARLDGSYSLQNQPGRYAPADLRHEATLRLSSPGGRQALAAAGTYDRALPKAPVRGSLTYTAQAGPAALEASVDGERYRLLARTAHGQLAAQLGRGKEGEARPAELELRLGRLSATAQLGERRRVRLALGP